MILMGLDVASTTGIARWDLNRSEASILCSTIKSPTNINVSRIFDEQVAYRLTNEFRADLKRNGIPDYVVMEAPMKRGPNADTIALMNTLTGAMTGVVAAIGCRFEVVASSEWRKAVYGFGTKRGWASKDWKRHARESAQQMGIVFSGDDEAEAALIAFYGGRCSQTVKMMRSNNVEA